MPWRSGLGGAGVAPLALLAVELALGVAVAAPVEHLLAALGQLVVFGDGPGAGRRDIPGRAGGQRAHRGLGAPAGEPAGQFPQPLRREHTGSRRGVHRLADSKLAHLGPDIDTAIHLRISPFLACRAGRPFSSCAGASAPELSSSVPPGRSPVPCAESTAWPEAGAVPAPGPVPVRPVFLLPVLPARRLPRAPVPAGSGLPEPGSGPGPASPPAAACAGPLEGAPAF